MIEITTAPEHMKRFPDLKIPEDYIVARLTEDPTLCAAGETEELARIGLGFAMKVREARKQVARRVRMHRDN